LDKEDDFDILDDFGYKVVNIYVVQIIQTTHHIGLKVHV